MRIIVIAAVFCVALLAFAHTHTYGNAWNSRDDGVMVTQNAGIVLWDCGPGFEWRGNPGFFVEGEC